MITVLGKGTKLYSSIREYRDLFLREPFLSIDPSCGSRSSQPGWAVWHAGELLGSGIFKIDPETELWERLQLLASYVKDAVETWQPSLLLYEEISAKPWGRRGGYNATGHASLLKSVGTIMSAATGLPCVGIRPSIWKKLTRPDYIKSDQADAVEMGWAVLHLVALVPEKKRGKR